MSASKREGVQGKDEDEGWEMVSRTENTEKKGRVRHLPIPAIPRPPRSKPIAIPKSLNARRMGRSLSINWGSHSDTGTSGPRGFKEGPIFVFPSAEKGDQWLWPGEGMMMEHEKLHPPFLSAEQKEEGKMERGGRETPPRPLINDPYHPPFLMPGQLVGSPDGQRSSGRETPHNPYTAPFSDQGDGRDFRGLVGTRDLGTVFRSEAPTFLHSFMPIPRLETDLDLPLNLSKMSL
jgi:hypothetical protein